MFGTCYLIVLSWPICFLHLATNKIIATLHAYQDSSEYKTGTDDGNFHAGLVNLEVKIHKPKDLDKIICDWNFGDGSQLNNSRLTHLSHNFTTVASSTVNVTLRGWRQGQYYIGNASKTFKFTGMIWLSCFDTAVRFVQWNSRMTNPFIMNSLVQQMINIAGQNLATYSKMYWNGTLV